jgi:hypothetical protein
MSALVSNFHAVLAARGNRKHRKWENMKSNKIWLMLMLTSTLSTLAQADGIKIEGMSVKINDSIEEAQKELNTSMEPEEIGTTVPYMTKKYQLHLKSKGILVSFEKGKVIAIRLDEPFSGNVGGIKLGDPSTKILKIFGKPIKEKSPLNNPVHNYTYYFDDITTTKFTVDSDEEVVSISLIK